MAVEDLGEVVVVLFACHSDLHEFRADVFRGVVEIGHGMYSLDFFEGFSVLSRDIYEEGFDDILDFAFSEGVLLGLAPFEVEDSLDFGFGLVNILEYFFDYNEFLSVDEGHCFLGDEQVGKPECILGGDTEIFFELECIEEPFFPEIFVLEIYFTIQTLGEIIEHCTSDNFLI